MKKIYSNPEIEMMMFTEEEILTDIIQSSQSASDSWASFIKPLDV